MNEIKEVETYRSNIVCAECEIEIDNSNCDECGCVLIEHVDYREGDKVFHIETEKVYAHFCSRECAEKYLKNLRGREHR